MTREDPMAYLVVVKAGKMVEVEVDLLVLVLVGEVLTLNRIFWEVGYQLHSDAHKIAGIR